MSYRTFNLFVFALIAGAILAIVIYAVSTFSHDSKVFMDNISNKSVMITGDH